MYPTLTADDWALLTAVMALVFGFGWLALFAHARHRGGESSP